MRVLDLFSGIGGFSLGLERAGMTTVAFCEIDPFCRRVLAKHWPGVPIYDDVRDVTAARLGADGIAVDVICGGFPCQDISSAGNKSGIDGERSGLWREYARLIGEIRPQFVIVENVADLLARGLGDVLGALAALGYDAEWDCVPAAYVGAPIRRDRLWLVAFPNALGRDDGSAQRHFFPTRWIAPPRRRDAYGLDLVERGPWSRLPGVLRMDHGLSARAQRARVAALGNAVVPQIPEMIGRAILQSEAA